MALNVTVHDPLTPSYGVAAEAPTLSADTAAFTVALGAQSVAIAGPAVVCLIADEAQRIAATKTAGYVAPAATGIKLIAGVERWYRIRAGSWYLNVVAG